LLPVPVRAASLSSLPHGFLGREGGVSAGVYASLNVGLGSSDDPSHIRTNRQRAVDAVLPGASLVTLHQVHSARAISVHGPIPDDERPEADGLVTRQPGMLIGVLTADCVPVLFADPEAGVVGAAHAGWKGASTGITDATIAAMERIGAERSRIVAAIGPCIARASYEVDEGFFRTFLELDLRNEHFFSAGTRAGHYQFDIEAYVAARLAEAGLRRVEMLGLDTYANEARFFSYRRATHRGETDYGRQLSVIGLPHP